jgi:hypothetical protein
MINPSYRTMMVLLTFWRWHFDYWHFHYVIYLASVCLGFILNFVFKSEMLLTMTIIGQFFSDQFEFGICVFIYQELALEWNFGMTEFFLTFDVYHWGRHLVNMENPLTCLAFLSTHKYLLPPMELLANFIIYDNKCITDVVHEPHN